MQELVRMTGIKKTYDGKRYVLNGTDFALEKGEAAVILGASGCGKSTFLNITGLLDSFSDGSYEFNGEKVKRRRLNSYYRQRAADIGFIFQSYCLIDSLSVKENVLMPFLYNGAPVDKKLLAELEQLLAELNMTELRDTKASLLSGGERQRVAICRAILKKPKLIIADEPTGNLDETNTELVIRAFSKIVEAGTSLVMVTHNPSLSFGSGKVYSLKDGILLQGYEK